MVLPDFYKGYHKEGAAMRKTKVKSTKGGQKQKLSNVPMPKAKPKFKGNTDALGVNISGGNVKVEASRIDLN